MQLPFTPRQFLAMFEQYNQAIWPTQVLAYILGVGAVLLVVNEVPHADRVISGILALFWLWIGLVFQLLYFREVNGAPAVFFGILMIFQAILFAVVGVVQHRLHFAASLEPSRLVGTLFIFYALYLYPVLGSLAGHGYPFSPLFGVAPCPTTIFTFGLLLWTVPKIPRYLLIIPFVWSLFSIGAALSLGIVEDFGLPLAAVIGTILLVRRDRPMTPKLREVSHHERLDTMEYKCEIKEQRAQPALSVRTGTPVGNLSQVMGDSYMAIAQYLAEIGQQSAGHPFAMYHNTNMEDLDVEIGFPVTSKLPGKGRIHVTELPAGKVATCLYTGPYNEIERGYNTLLDWMLSNHNSATGIAYEVYLNDPGDTAPQELKTLIVFPLE